MKITHKALVQIKDPQVRMRIALALGVSDQTICRHIKENGSNGELTKAAAIQVIREVTGLGDSDILEEVEIAAAA